MSALLTKAGTSLETRIDVRKSGLVELHKDSRNGRPSKLWRKVTKFLDILVGSSGIQES